MSSEGTTSKQQVYVCGTCENVILNLDSLKHHLVFTHGCNKLTKDRFPTCACGTTYDNRSLWNHHACPGKTEIMKNMFNRMVEKDKTCYRTDTASVTKRAAYKSPAKKTPKKATPRKNVTSAKKKKVSDKAKKKSTSKKKKEKKDKREKKDKKAKKKKTSSDSAISVDSDSSSESETIETTSEESTTSSGSESESSSGEESPSKKRKASPIKRIDKRPKPEITEEHDRQWKLMRVYSEPFQLGDPDQTISRQSLSDLVIHERPGCITFLKTYSNLVSPFHGFAKREILRFVQGDSRMFICRDTKSPESIASAVNIAKELKPRVIKLWQEDKELKDAIVSSTPYFWADTIVLPSGNMVGVYTNDNTLQKVAQRDMVCVTCLPFNVVISQGFLDLLEKYKDCMVPIHNSTENTHWKGFSLKGYTPSHKDLYKPEEMEKNWQKEHSISGTQSYEADLQSTDLMVHFQYYLSQLKKSIPGKFHRIQVLSLAPGGKVGRHSERPSQPDLDAGKLLLRVHVPLITNESAKVKIWSLEYGTPVEINMEVGFIYLLDNRKPYEIVNGGETIYHLVFDVVLNSALEPIVESSFQISTPLADFSEKFQAWKEATKFDEIRLEENEEEKKLGEEKRIEMEANRKNQRIPEQKEENVKSTNNQEDKMDVESTTHHSENLFSPKKNNDNNNNNNNMEENEIVLKKAKHTESSSAVSISDRFENDSTDAISDESDEKDNSNYKLGKRAPTSANNPAKAENTKKSKKATDFQKAVDSKVEEIVTTIYSDDEVLGEEKAKRDGFVSGDLEEFLTHYDLSQFEEAFRKNRLDEKVSTFSHIGTQDLRDMGFGEEDLLKWKKFNPSL